MSLQALTDADEIAVAFSQFARHFEIGAEILERSVGYHGGKEQALLHWFHDLKFWALLQPDRIGNRYWCVFGIEDPHAYSLLPITFEINPPRKWVDRRCAGLFVRSDNRTIYLAHSGKIGGGRSGIGKSNFLEFYGDDTLDIVNWPDNRTSSYIVIGTMTISELNSQNSSRKLLSSRLEIDPLRNKNLLVSLICPSGL